MTARRDQRPGRERRRQANRVTSIAQDRYRPLQAQSCRCDPRGLTVDGRCIRCGRPASQGPEAA